MNRSAAEPAPGRRRTLPTDALRPGRVNQTSSAIRLTASAGAMLALLVGLAIGSWFVPLLAFFAVGAGAGYSLSGSV